MKKRSCTQVLFLIIICLLLTSCGNTQEAKGVSEGIVKPDQEEVTDITTRTKPVQSTDSIDSKTSEALQDEAVSEKKTSTFNQVVPSNVSDSLINLNQILKKTSEILNEIELKSSDSSNIYANKDITTLRNQFIDQYTASGEYFRDISFYRYYDKESTDDKIKDEIYNFGTIYQDAMYQASNGIYQVLYGKGDTRGFDLSKAAFELRLKKAEDLVGNIQSNLTVGQATDYTNIALSDDLDAIILLDTLWISHQGIWRKHGEYFEKDTTFSKLPVEDALEEIDPLIGYAKEAMEHLKIFSRKYDLERQDDWNLEDGGGIIDNWHTAANDQLFAIQIYGNKSKLEDFYGGPIYLPTDDMIKYDIRYEMQSLDYKEFQWQYTRARDFLRSQQDTSNQVN